MNKEAVYKKLQHIKDLLTDLERLLGHPLAKFLKNIDTIRSAERNFELMVETADDINAHLLTDKTGRTPDTYTQALLAMANAGILDRALSERLVVSVKIRNILVHEYDFEEDYEKFYHSAKACIPAYREYLRRVRSYVQKNL